MNNSFIPLGVIGILIAGISTASAKIALPAPLIEPGMMDDFQNKSTNGWTNGARVVTHHPPEIKQNGNNYYLEVTSKGKPAKGESSHNKRMTVFNATYDWTPEAPESTPFESKWAGDYSNIVRIEGKAMANSETAEKLYLRLALSDWFTYYPYDDDGPNGAFYASKTAVEIPTNGVWTGFSFTLDAVNFLEQTDTGRSFTDALKSISEIRFTSDEEPKFWEGDEVKAKLGFDDITAVGAAAVPLPATAWLMVSGLLLSLGSLSSYKSRHNA